MWNKKFWTEGTGSLFVAVLIALTIRWGLFEAYVIPSGSMLPTLLINDHIFVNKFIYGLRIPFTEEWLYKNKEPQRGEVIVFRYPDDPSIYFIKRVVGIPGDKITYEDGNLYINDELVEKKVPQNLKGEMDWLRDEDFVKSFSQKSDFVQWEEVLGTHTHSILLKKQRPYDKFGPYYVPPESYFVLGDNRDNSKDSRLWETTHFVPRKNLIGRAMFVWLSCEEKIPKIGILCMPNTIRWKRFFHQIK